MKNKFFSAIMAAACLTGTAVAQEPTIEWTVVEGALSGAVGGIQMHGQAALDVDGQTMLYALGGNRAADGGDSVRISYAPLNLEPTPTVGTFSHTTFEFDTDTAGNAVGSNYIERTTLAYDGRIYVVGGSHNVSGESALNAIRVFEPTASGDILEANPDLGFDGATAGVTPSLGSAGSSAAIDPETGYLYVVGGSADTTVRRFSIDETTGAVSDYQVLSTPLLHPSYFSSGMVIKDGYLYIISSHNTADRGKVQYAPINEDGTLGAFSLTSANLPNPHIDGGSLVLNGEIYVVAGHTGGGNPAVTNTVHRSVSGENGDITAWVEDAAIPGADLQAPAGLRRVGLAPLPDNSGFVIIGGRNVESFPEHVFVAQLVNASVDAWSLY